MCNVLCIHAFVGCSPRRVVNFCFRVRFIKRKKEKTLISSLRRIYGSFLLRTIFVIKYSKYYYGNGWVNFLIFRLSKQSYDVMNFFTFHSSDVLIFHIEQLCSLYG